MSEPISLGLAQSFELERMTRIIDSTSDLAALKGLAKQLLQAWYGQKAATEWVMRQSPAASFRVDPETVRPCRLATDQSDQTP